MTCIHAREIFGRCQILPRGYATVGSTVGRKSRRPVYAHRHVFEQSFGDIPEGHEIHHVCHTRDCVNPEHLVVMTRRDHIQIHRTTHCREGHEMTPENTIRDPFPRCRTCRTERLRQRRQKARV